MTKLTIALPAKGRMQVECDEYFRTAGLNINRPSGSRDYRGYFDGIDGVEIVFLSASEIPNELVAGSIHLGVTGKDLILEKVPNPETKTILSIPLGIGQADVVVAVPNSWIDISTMEDLGDAAFAFWTRNNRRFRVATKYANLTRNFFSKLGINEYQVVESIGATEGAPTAGLSELIVDITSTGSTLNANNLKVPADGLILKSEAYLCASLAANWTKEDQKSAQRIYSQIEAVIRARSLREVKFDFQLSDKQVNLVKSKYSATLPFNKKNAKNILFVPKNKSIELAFWLESNGANSVAINSLEYVFEKEKSAFDLLRQKLRSAEKARIKSNKN